MENEKVFKILIIVGVLLILLIAFTYFLPQAVDWSNMYRPAALALIEGHSPYKVNNFSNAPWVLIPMIPLLILPESLGRAILAMGALISLALVAHKLGGKLIGIVFLLLSPPVIGLILDGNIDWIVALGFILPPQYGLFLLAIKPQIGVAVAIYWFILTWKTKGLIEVVKVFGPVAIALLISFLIFGFWPMNFNNAFGWGGNASLWPISIPVGLGLLVASIRKQNISYAISASPCLSPYLLLHSWIGPLIALASSQYEMAAVVIGLWILTGLRGFGF